MIDVWDNADAVKHWLSQPAAEEFRRWLKSLLDHDLDVLAVSDDNVVVHRTQGAAMRTKKILELSNEIDQFLANRNKK